MKSDNTFLHSQTMLELFQQAPYFICILRGPEHVFEIANDKYYQLIGRKEIIGKKVKDALPEVVDQGFTKLLDNVYSTGLPYHGSETKILLRRSETNILDERYVNFIYQPLKDSLNQVTGIFVHGVDVTDSVISRENATKSEARLRKLVDANIVGIIFWDINGKILNANEIFLHTIGYTRSELEEGKIDWISMTPSEYQDLDKNAVEELYRLGAHSPVQKEYIRKDGSRVDVLVGSTFLDSSKVEGIGFVLDISSEVNSRKNAQNSQEQFKNLSDSMPQLVWSANPDGKVDYYNQKYKEFAGIKKKGEEYEWTLVVHKEDLEKTIQAWSNAILTGTVYEVEHRIKLKSGEFSWFLSRGIPVKDKSGKIIKWYGTATNINELKKLEQQKDQFIAVASHELKTPITSIKAYQQVLKKHSQTQNNKENTLLLTKMEKQIDKLNLLVNDLLDVTKIQAGKLQLRVSYFNLQEVVREVVTNIQMTTKSHKIEFNSQQELMIHADKDRLIQVIENYITNAIKYSPKAKKVIVRVKMKDSFVELSVEDFGVGIPQGKLDKIFERFYQVEEHDRKAFAGLGLGLFISKEIITRHNGQVWATSEVDQGSRFYFKLPI